MLKAGFLITRLISVLQIVDTHDSFFIDDGTGVGLVSGYSKIQFASSKPAIGNLPLY